MSDGNASSPKDEMLSSADYVALLEAVQQLHECRSLKTFPDRVVRVLSHLIPCDLAAYNEVNIALGRMVMKEIPEVPKKEPLVRAWERWMGQHPVLSYYRETGDGQALAISDFLEEEEFHALAIYRECYAHLGAEDQLAAGIFLGDSVVIGLAFNRRECSFTMRERTLLNLMRSHVVQAYLAAREFDSLREERQVMIAALGNAGHGVVRFDDRGLLEACSPEVPPALGVRDKEAVARLDWLMQGWQEAMSTGNALTPSPDNDLLKVRWRRAGSRWVGIISEAADSRVARQFGLSRREAEVLRWMAEGKSNGEISLILGIAEGTVKIHVQRVLIKLGTPNRAAAVAMLRGDQDLA